MAKGVGGRIGNLPAELTSMVGRRVESGAVKRMLAASRLVTLTGTGGVGKTRLAMHVARQRQPAFPDGVWLVPLAELAQPDLLALTVMAGITRSSGNVGIGIAELTAYVDDRRMLLVLDNCEHLIDACAKLTADLLRTCPHVRVLATSREPLRIEGEAVFDVPPLRVPRGDGDALAARSYDSVQLFLDRASSVFGDSTLTREQEQAVCALCQRLDGLPLAIELAAIRSRALSIDELLARQNDRFGVLTAGNRTAPPRHRTLRAVVDYSYQLCSPQARLLWARMSVFAGGGGLEAAEAVCAGPGLTVAAVSQALSELVDKSIVTFDGARYRMLETIREYGQERLRDLGDERRVRLAHRDCFAGLAEEVSAGAFGGDQPALLGQALADHANIRAALDFCVTEPGQATTGLRMAGVLSQLWMGCGLHAEGRRWLDLLLAADHQASAERVRALCADALVVIVLGDVSAALPLLDECDELSEALGNEEGRAYATLYRGTAENMLGRTAEGIVHQEKAVRLGRRLPAGHPMLPEALLNLGWTLCFAEQLDRAADVLEEGIERCAARGEQWMLSWCEMMLGLATLLDGRRAEATRLLKQGLSRKRALGDLLGIGLAIEFLAWTAIEDGDDKRGARLLGAGQALTGALGAYLLGYQRLLDWHDERVGHARGRLGPRAYDRALRYGHDLGRDRVIGYALGEATPADSAATGNGEELPLTPREREIAGLVAAGKTNKQIAGQLVIAVRTVDTHVENILTKLGFNSRAQVAALLAGRTENPRADTS
ncbi:MAG TPA: LuxR C-terminal-related transcriptional regulator [Amycolatopsis sp.]|nr:LuxR C-terminal-related transcriptional regulator [Amycolatopsis sp.]